MAAPETSRVAQTRIIPTRCGWCRVVIDGTPAAVRFDGAPLRIVEQVIAGLATLPVSRLTAWANGPDGETIRVAVKDRLTGDTAGVDATERSDPSMRAGWGASPEAAEDAERMVALCDLPSSLVLDGATRKRKPHGFYETFAALYRRLAVATSRPAVVVAQANEVKVSTVHGWVKVSKSLGLL